MAINKDNLSTKFDDWVEKNLLDISSFDLNAIRMQDYSTDMVQTETGEIGMAPVFHSSFKINYNASALSEKWQLASLRRMDPTTSQRVDVTLAPEETLNESKLEEMRQAFDDLKIIDVLRKPESIASAQRAGEVFVKSTEDIETLHNVGYMLHMQEMAGGQTAIRIYSRQGEAFIDMNDGIVYHLMFGNLTGTSVADSTKVPTTPEAEGESTTDIGGSVATNVLSANRYLMILAEFDESILEKPAPTPLTDVPTEGDEAEIANLKQQRESQERLNRQQEDEYAATIDAGKRRAQELNRRFADWFFVISDDVFKKIRVTDSDLIIRPGEPAPDPEYNAGLDTMQQNFHDALANPGPGIGFRAPTMELEPITEPEPADEPNHETESES
jgi:hypothetical protein